MKRFDQEYLALFGDDGNQIQRGDCFRCAIAMLLSDYEPGIELSDVPHFFAGLSNKVNIEPDVWLKARGYKLHEVPVGVFDFGDSPQTGLLDVAAVCSGESPWIACGKSPRNGSISHAVAMAGPVLFHDPHPDRLGVLSLNYLYRIESLSRSSDALAAAVG